MEAGDALGSGGFISGGDVAYPRVYVTVLAVLAPYRGRGIGSALLSAILDGFDARPTPLPVTLHVHDERKGGGGPTSAGEFYTKFGFVCTGKVDNYYRRLECPTALVLTRPAAVGGKVAVAVAVAVAPAANANSNAAVGVPLVAL